jgi:hypothetical protein
VLTAPTPTSLPASVPLPSVAPGDAVLPSDIENRSVLLILESLIPVGLLLGGVLLAAHLRRR